MHCNGHISKENDCWRSTEMQCNPTLTAGEHVPRLNPRAVLVGVPLPGRTRDRKQPPRARP